MQRIKLFLGETTPENPGMFRLNSAAIINMAGVILFYVILFVAFNVFSN